MEPAILNILLKIFGNVALTLMAAGVSGEDLKAAIDSEEARTEAIAKRAKELGA